MLTIGSNFSKISSLILFSENVDDSFLSKMEHLGNFVGSSVQVHDHLNIRYFYNAGILYLFSCLIRHLLNVISSKSKKLAGINYMWRVLKKIPVVQLILLKEEKKEKRNLQEY